MKQESSPTECQSGQALQLDLAAGELEPDHGDQVLLEEFPGVAVEVIAQLAEVVHFAPAVSSPFASGHVDNKVSVLLVVVNALIVAIVGASPVRETVDHPLRNECRMLPDPRLRLVELLEGVLLLVLPLHVLLLVHDGIPPDIEQPIGPVAASDKERSQVEPRAVLWQDQIHRVYIAITFDVLRVVVEIVGLERVGDVERVVLVDIAVDVVFEVVEDVALQGVGRLHDKGIQVQPPDPILVSFSQSICPDEVEPSTHHSALGYFLKLFLMASTFSQLSRHSWA